ncbi:GNAT family acetyltransferase [Paraburkholderia eburnea]|uniref:GNAT family acetyltransferase n=1 Tax=Paraburkholderia eburnea TaxID=1189126 RepID=A0A2S4M0B6_9BURK|nr:GNAT family acetyltransferase [Paraburkholderia eburnea]POR48161.1 GNAT family acetyltransferase [Paraburkholderia eburnea]PRZ22256.1 GNAT family acetyltransferase [Paraburkholderia eburnea]
MSAASITIRAFDEADTEAVLALWLQAFPEYGDPTRPHRDPRLSIANKLGTQPELFFVATRGEDGAIVGTAMTGYDGHRGWLYSLAVAPEARRLGIGTRLVRHAESALAAMGCLKLNLQVLADKPEVIAFYDALGYRADAVVSLGKRLGVQEPEAIA